jgi:hypothetical protein
MINTILLIVGVILFVIMIIQLIGTLLKDMTEEPALAGCVLVLVLGMVIYLVINFQTVILDNFFANKQLIEYFDKYLDARAKSGILDSPGFPTDSAFANRDTDLKKGPSTKFVNITKVSKDKQVILLYTPGPVETSEEYDYREENWIKVNFEGQEGWIDGRDFRVPTIWDMDGFWRRAFNSTLNFLFPEDTFIGKVLGFFSGLIVSFIVNRLSKVLGFFEKTKSLSPAAFFIVKALVFRTISVIESGLFFWIYIIFSAIIEFIIDAVISS